jgi:hypothetical protein
MNSYTFVQHSPVQLSLHSLEPYDACMSLSSTRQPILNSILWPPTCGMRCKRGEEALHNILFLSAALELIGLAKRCRWFGVLGVPSGRFPTPCTTRLKLDSTHLNIWPTVARAGWGPTMGAELRTRSVIASLASAYHQV